MYIHVHCRQLRFSCLNIQIDVWPGFEILNQNSYSSHDLKVSSQVCTVYNTLFTNVGRGKWGVVWGWGGDGLLVGPLDSAPKGPKWSPS